MRGKNVLLMTLAFIFLSVLCYSYVFDYSSLTTDSGFDTGYDGGSSFDSDYGGSSFDFGSSSSYSYSGSSGDSSPIVAFAVLFIIIFFIILVLALKDHVNSHTKTNYQQPALLSPEDEATMAECFKIYCDVQMAWMEFNYDKMRELVTDELFNQYQNQLKQLELKGEKNIMSNFLYNGGHVVRRYQENGIDYVEVELITDFYDYIVNQDNEIVRGSNANKVSMVYDLLFVMDKNAIDTCPNCAAKLSDGMTKCPYCKSTIQSTRSSLKLASKKVINQYTVY